MAFDGHPIQYYRDQARRIRRQAECARTPEVREQLAIIADDYEDMASRRERDLIYSSPSSRYRI